MDCSGICEISLVEDHDLKVGVGKDGEAIELGEVCLHTGAGRLGRNGDHLTLAQPLTEDGALGLDSKFAPACMEQRYKFAQIMQDWVAARECHPGHCGIERVELVANVGGGESRAMLMDLIGEHRVQGVAVVGEQPIGKECWVGTACYVVYNSVLAPCSIRSGRQLMYIL